MMELVRRLSWPQVVALAVLVTGGVVALIFVPADRWEVIAGVIATLVAGTGGVIGGPLVRTPEAQHEHDVTRASRRRAREVQRQALEVLSEPPPNHVPTPETPETSTLSSTDATPASSPRAARRRDTPPASTFHPPKEPKR